MQKPYTLVIPSWYPTDTQPLNGIFIEKHVRAISCFHDVVVMYVTGDQKRHAEEKAISDSYTSYTHYYAETGSRGFNQFKYIWAQIRAYRYIVSKCGRPDSLHLHVVFPAGIFVYLLLLCCDIPLIITEHWSGYTDEDGRYQRQSGLIKYLTSVLFKKARKISVVSQYLKKAVIKQGLANDDKICIASNILNIPATQVTASPAQPNKALFIGNLNDHEKNLTALITAVSKVADRYPTFELTMIGGGAESQKFIDLARSKGILDKNIFFKGYVPNTQLQPIYQAHSFFILTSNFETFNIAAAEALLNGLPVVSTMCGGPSEYINEHTGLWIRDYTADGIALGIMEMIERFTTFDRPAIAADMRQKYGYDTIVGELKDLYSTLV